MRFEDLKKIVETASYKPRTKFTCKEAEDDDKLIVFTLQMQTFDAERPDHQTTILLHETKPLALMEMVSLDEVAGLLYSMARRLELHEIDEFLRIGGVRYRNPHPERM